jgi:hypothetical protein
MMMTSIGGTLCGSIAPGAGMPDVEAEEVRGGGGKPKHVLSLALAGWDRVDPESRHHQQPDQGRGE